MIGTTELMLVLALAVILFGPDRLPEIGRSLGEAYREFKKALYDTGEKELKG